MTKKNTLLSFAKLYIALFFFIGINTFAQCSDFTSATPYDSNNSNKGVMFNVITNTTPVTVTSLDFNMIGTNTGDFEVYYKVSSYAGSESTAASWTLIGTATNVTSLGTNAVTPIPLPLNIVIPAGSTYGFYITNNNNASTAGIRYTNNSGAYTIASDANIAIFGSVGKSYPFGTNYNNRSVNCTVHYSAGNIATATVLATTNALATVSNQNSAGNSVYAASCNQLIASVLGTGVSPISGNTIAKVWKESMQPSTFVKRHYEILPSINPNSVTGDVTLYFTQQEFDDFNAVNTLLLPTSPIDTSGKSNLLIELIQGTTSSTGLPATYTGTSMTINPSDANIIWDSINNYWKVTFSTTGFGGFFAKTTNVTLETSNFDISSNFKIYPNPATSTITIDLSSVDNPSVDVYDIDGRKILTQKLSNSSNTINIDNLSSGLYLFKVTSDQGTATSKVVKN
jgi:hypothetical protein